MASAEQGYSVLRIGALVVDLHAKRIAVHGRALALTRTEYAIFEGLALRADREVRFPNEVEVVHALGGVVIRLIRPGRLTHAGA